tara:strand:+ start:396 stop:668 length:273 start_codon:yes stop_codon:yes gene_type:complete
MTAGKQLYQSDRFEEDPDKRVNFCPISFKLEKEEMLTIPTAQKMILDANTQKELSAVLAQIARKMAGVCSDSPETYNKLIEVEQKASKEH